jgi:hypothetical protein
VEGAGGESREVVAFKCGVEARRVGGTHLAKGSKPSLLVVDMSVKV